VTAAAKTLQHEEASLRNEYMPEDPFQILEGDFCNLRETQDYLTSLRMYVMELDQVRSARSLRKMIEVRKLMHNLCVEEREVSPYRLPQFILMLPQPQSLQHAYNLIYHYAIEKRHVYSYLPEYESLAYNMFDEPPPGWPNARTKSLHCVAYAIIKIKLYVELSKFLRGLDAVLLQQRDAKWNNSAIVASFLPFIWPSQHYFSPAYICTAVGTARASVGALRTQQRRLRAQVGVLLPRIAQLHGAHLWSTLANVPYKQLLDRVEAATMRGMNSFSGRADMYTDPVEVLACDYVPLLRGDPFPTVAGVREVLGRYVNGLEY
jgi:hypothetical protein